MKKRGKYLVVTALSAMMCLGGPCALIQTVCADEISENVVENAAEPEEGENTGVNEESIAEVKTGEESAATAEAGEETGVTEVSTVETEAGQEAESDDDSQPVLEPAVAKGDIIYEEDNIRVVFDSISVDDSGLMYLNSTVTNKSNYEIDMYYSKILVNDIVLRPDIYNRSRLAAGTTQSNSTLLMDQSDPYNHFNIDPDNLGCIHPTITYYLRNSENTRVTGEGAEIHTETGDNYDSFITPDTQLVYDQNGYTIYYLGQDIFAEDGSYDLFSYYAVYNSTGETQKVAVDYIALDGADPESLNYAMFYEMVPDAYNLLIVRDYFGPHYGDVMPSAYHTQIAWMLFNEATSVYSDGRMMWDIDASNPERISFTAPEQESKEEPVSDDEEIQEDQDVISGNNVNSTGKSQGSSSASVSSAKSPKTGDENNLLLPGLTAILSLLGLTGMHLHRRRFL